MSLDATNWAWRVQFKNRASGSLKPLKRLVLLSFADRAGEDHTCYPSVKRLEDDTNLDRKTVMKIIAELIEDGLIVDTGERKGRTKQVKVYRLVGVNGRETVPTIPPLDEENTDLNSTIDGTVPTTEQYQQFRERVPTIPSKSTNNGTRNLPENLLEESKNKKSWLCLKKLQEEIFLSDDTVDFVNLIQQRWYHRELQAFEKLNADKNHNDDFKIYLFADWLLYAKAKYDKRENRANTENHKPVNSGTADQPQPVALKKLSDAQRSLLATRLADHSEFSSNHIPTGYGYTQALQWINQKLADPESLTEWTRFIRDVGFAGCVRGVAA